MCRLARKEYEEEVKRNKEIHDAIAAERARQKYEKHYGICREVSRRDKDQDIIRSSRTEPDQIEPNWFKSDLIESWYLLTQQIFLM